MNFDDSNSNNIKRDLNEVEIKNSIQKEINFKNAKVEQNPILEKKEIEKENNEVKKLN